MYASKMLCVLVKHSDTNFNLAPDHLHLGGSFRQIIKNFKYANNNHNLAKNITIKFKLARGYKNCS